MSYVPYDTFLPEVLPYANGCPEAVAINAVRNAAIEFATTTEWLQFTPPPITGVLGQATYELSLPGDTRLLRVTQAFWDSLELWQTTPEKLGAQWGYDWRILLGTPRAITRVDGGEDEIMLVPAPDGSSTLANALQVICSLCPTRWSRTCDPVLWERFGEVIGAGARARLHAMPAQPFTNMPAAAAEYRQFRGGMSEARIERMRALDKAPLVLRPPRIV